MKMAELLRQDAVIASLKVSAKKTALQELARRAAAITGLPEREVFEALQERERLGSTGIGHGIAVPHGKFAGLDRIVGVFARLATAVDFEAVDDLPVDLIFLLLAPEGSGAEHLTALAGVSRMLRNTALCQKLRGSDNPGSLYALLTAEPESHAA